MKLIKNLTIFLSIVVSFSFIIHPLASAATLGQQLEEVQRRLGEIGKKKQDLQAEINKYKSLANSYDKQIKSLSAEISLLDSDIDEKQLQIDELNLSISILNEEIETGEAIISQTEYDAGLMQEQVDSKIKGMYLDYKTGIGSAVMDAGFQEESAFKKLQYKTVIVDQTKELVGRLSTKLAELSDDKGELEEKQVKLKRDKTAIDEAKAALDSKKSELAVQRQAFYDLQNQARASGNAVRGEYQTLNEDEVRARAEAERIQQQIFASTGSVPNGSFVVAGTRIGYQGMTGIATGPHLHFIVSINGTVVNPCGKLPSGPFSNCVGDRTLPFWPLQTTHYFTSSFGDRCYNHNGYRRCTFHGGIDLAASNRTAPIFAAHDGWMRRGFDPCSGSICNGGGANYVVICQYRENCNRGVKTGYWHLSGF